MDLKMAQRLVDRRRAAGFSQEALAEQLGVSRQAVSKWERSESSPDTDNLIALAALYDVSLDELLYGEPPQENETDAAENEESIEEAGSGATPDADAHSTDTGDSQTANGDPSGPDSAHTSAKPDVKISWHEGIHVSDPAKGEEVHVGWDGVHVDSERTGEHVHIGAGGMHIDAIDSDGHGVRTNPDGSVTIDGEQFGSWKEAHDALNRHGGHFRTRAGRTWAKFPYPALLALIYIVLGITYGTWGTGLFLFFTVPVYYTIGDFIDRRELSKLIGGIYPVAAVAWFFYMWLICNHPHPAWTVLITIPAVEIILDKCRKQWKRQSQH